MQLAQLKVGLRRYGFNEEDPLSTWLNAALHDIVAAWSWPWLEVQTAVAVSVVGSGNLVLPSDAFRVKSLYDVTNGLKLEEIDRTRFDRETHILGQSGTPIYYILTGLTNVQIWPYTDKAITYFVIYEKEIADMVDDTDVPDIPEALHYAIIAGGAMYGLQAENEEQRAETAKSEFEAIVNRNIDRYANRTLDQPKQVVDVQGYGDL